MITLRRGREGRLEPAAPEKKDSRFRERGKKQSFSAPGLKVTYQKEQGLKVRGAGEPTLKKEQHEKLDEDEKGSRGGERGSTNCKTGSPILGGKGSGTNPRP